MESGGSDSSEAKLFERLERSLGGSSSFDSSWRVQLLEDLISRLRSGSVVDTDKVFELSLDFAKLFGIDNVVSSLIRDCFLLLIDSDQKYFDMALEELGKNQKTVSILSNLVLELDYKKKQKAVRVLVDSLGRWSSTDKNLTKTLYENIVEMGKQNLASEIVKESSRYLDSSISKPSVILQSLRLCVKFGDKSLTPKMVNLFEKALDGYFGSEKQVIYQEICSFIERTGDSQAFRVLLRFSADSMFRHTGGKKALASVLNSNPSLVEFVVERLHDTDDSEEIESLISALEKTESEVDPNKLFRALLRGEKTKYPLGWQIESILVRAGDKSKNVLLELLKDDSNYEFALDILSKIGVKREDLYKIFPESPMLQIYNFFYGKRNRNPCGFIKTLKKPSRLNEEIPGKKPTALDFLVTNIFSSFNLATMNVDLSGKAGVDVVAFNPETLDVLVIGCTAGTVKDDLKTIDALLEEMKSEIPNIFKNCNVVPLIFSTGTPKFVPSDLVDAKEIGAVLLGLHDLEKIVDMLCTGRDIKNLLNYVNEIRIEQNESVGPSFNSKY